MSRDVIDHSRRVGVRGLNPRVSRESVSRVNVYVPKHKHARIQVYKLMMEQDEHGLRRLVRTMATGPRVHRG